MEMQPIEDFFPALAQNPVAREAILRELGEFGPGALDKLIAGVTLDNSELGAHDILTDLIHNEAEVVESLTGYGGYATFSISIMRFGPVFYVSANEFDDRGYFGSLESAREAALSDFAGYLEPPE